MSTPEESRPLQGLEILDKADAVLRVLERRGTISVNDLAEQVGEPISSTYRLLKSLTTLGWVEPAPRRGTYRLGLYPLTVGEVCDDDLDVREAIRPVLKDLHDTTGMACLLWVRRGPRAVCIDRIEASTIRISAIRLGDSLPLHVAGGARALLASLPEGELDSVMAGLPSDPDVPDATTLRNLLDLDRRRGWVVNHAAFSVHGLSVSEIGCPVTNHRGELAASISVRGLQQQVNEAGDELVDRVRAGARSASQALGSREEVPGA